MQNEQKLKPHHFIYYLFFVGLLSVFFFLNFFLNIKITIIFSKNEKNITIIKLKSKTMENGYTNIEKL